MYKFSSLRNIDSEFNVLYYEGDNAAEELRAEVEFMIGDVEQFFHSMYGIKRTWEDLLLLVLTETIAVFSDDRTNRSYMITYIPDKWRIKI